MRTLLWLLLLVSAVVEAQNATTATDLLTRAASTGLESKTLRLTGTRTRDLSFGIPTAISPDRQHVIQSFRFEREADGKTREEVREGNSTTLTVFDGSRVWVYRSANNTYASRPATRFLTDSSGFASLEFGRQPANVLSANIQGHETLMFGGEPELCYVVIAQYKGTPGDETVPGLLRYSARKVWIGQNTGLVLRDNWEFESVYGGVSTRVSNVYDYSNIETDVPLAADLFSFSPPRGSVASAPVQFQPPTAVPGAVPKLAADATTLPIPTADSGFAISFDATNTGVRWAITGRVRGRATSDGKTIDISVEECEILRPGTFGNPQEIRRITAGIIRHGDSENVRWVMFADSHPVNHTLKPNESLKTEPFHLRIALADLPLLKGDALGFELVLPTGTVPIYLKDSLPVVRVAAYCADIMEQFKNPGSPNVQAYRV